jgi:hypothetical protein
MTMNKGTSKKIGVVYTCITGGYDELRDHTYTNTEWDYVCFTDDLSIKNNSNSLWEIRPILFDKLDDVRNQRWHKLNPHLLFPEYEMSIWVDANVDVISKDLFDDVGIVIDKKKKMAIPIHPARKCIYDEFDVCIAIGKDKEDTMKKQAEMIKKEGFPEEQGLFETNIIYREHGFDKVIAVMNEWWWWIENYSRRDQLSLTYVLWKNKLDCIPLAESAYRNSGKIVLRYDENHVTKEELIIQKKKLLEEIKQKEKELLLLKSMKYTRLFSKAIIAYEEHGIWGFLTRLRKYLFSQRGDGANNRGKN